MKVLGRVLASPFDAFWDLFGTETDVAQELIEGGHEAVFGPECYREDSAGRPRFPAWFQLPHDALGYHVAHELTQLVMRKRGFPVTLRGPEYAETSPEARLCGDVHEMVSHPAMEEILGPLPFDRSHIQGHLFEGVPGGACSSPRCPR